MYYNCDRSSLHQFHIYIHTHCINVKQYKGDPGDILRDPNIMRTIQAQHDAFKSHKRLVALYPFNCAIFLRYYLNVCAHVFGCDIYVRENNPPTPL